MERKGVKLVIQSTETVASYFFKIFFFVVLYIVRLTFPDIL